MKTVKQLIKEAESHLDDEHKDVNVAKVLFYHLAKKEPHELYLMMDEEVDPELEKQFLAGMEEYYNGKPIQYIKGYETFFGRDFDVNEDVLIPRYETEELVENILYRIDDYFSDYQDIHLCDVGTGSGAIAITLALEEPRLKVIATDISDDALTVAKHNAKKLGANIEFRSGDMLEPLLKTNEKVDIFVSNPPYIPNDQEIEAMVKDNEPHVALFGGNDGLYFYRKIFNEVKPLLNDRALLAFEMGFDQRELMEEAIHQFFGDVPFEIIKDINGKDRMLFIYHHLKDHD
ncbi:MULTISPECIES: peptide chain release factor N(5)-glutamine methyltransferase [Coprobacillaceae]|uniref:peptide chain release factor N(5)-glutamine methyltransferase n=1 Tax=Coprobacillaceae TaxID=2810280 RepID=UPI000E4DFBFA|nr:MULTISPECIES: peptide chain release factor N(5)-glutamine methyltransferase [Coprobacillaceae]RHM61322.1 peptide chain release factor N(5)-glutamine methyltransferase [Coprobacillus sp. AF33-1AC]RHS95903.1 peptide chain release factor N(5)-glutamine methyltransferase [Erysipelatoclostridium sp. AM42-17]